MDDRLKKQLDFSIEIDAGDTYAYDAKGKETHYFTLMVILTIINLILYCIEIFS